MDGLQSQVSRELEIVDHLTTKSLATNTVFWLELIFLVMNLKQKTPHPNRGAHWEYFWSLEITTYKFTI